MQKMILSKDDVHNLVLENKYKVNEKLKFISRCIDGRYPTSLDLSGASLGTGLPPLAIAGADAGELAIIITAGNAYGFEVNIKKTYETLVKVVGGVKNFQMHSDYHGNPKVAASGCGHIKQMGLDPVAYNLEKAQVEELQKILEDARKKGANEVVLEGEHGEGAVVIVKGDYSVKTQSQIETETGPHTAQVFVFQNSLVDARHRLLAKELIKNKAVKLLNDLDDEYLYEVLSDVTETHLMETAKRLANGLPIYSVVFSADGTFTIDEMGTV